MHLYFDPRYAAGYHSEAQIARVLTENWLIQNAYCVSCGQFPLSAFPNNNPVGDFYCAACSEQFELKSKNAAHIGNKINDGAYHTMIARINTANNPNFYFLSYQKADYSVQQLILVPKHFFTPSIIIARKPLAETARRAGWTGYIIDLSQIPENGKIYLINQQREIDKNRVIEQWKHSLFLRAQSLQQKGWLLAIMKCLDDIPQREFSLKDVYQFESRLALLFPNNRTIKDKIRQQLQLLRDRNIIEFVNRGHYRKIN